MLVVFEGVDCTGKTTLARQVLPRDGRYLHRGPPAAHPLEEYAFELENDSFDTVCDRWHIGERIWPTVFLRPTEYDDAMHNWVEAYLRSRGALLVHCTGDPDAVRERLAAREEPRYDVAETMKWFAQEARRTQLPTLTHSVEDRLHPDRVLKIADGVWASQAAGFFDRRRVGNWHNPKWWLVGDQPKDDDNALPFVPYPATSGHYLFGLELPWKRIAVSNSLGIDLHATWRYLRDPKVVALGNLASARLRRFDVPHRKVPHPQFVRRFHHKRHVEYRNAILFGMEFIC